MRLALAGGLESIVDPDLFASAMTAKNQAAWEEFERLEPFGTEHFYKVLAQGFYAICRSFHDPEFASELRISDFHWWGEVARKEAEDEDKPVDQAARVARMEAHAAKLLLQQKLASGGC